MKYCSRCGSHLADDAAFCVRCGQRMMPQNQNGYGYHQDPNHQQPNQGRNPHQAPGGYQGPGQSHNQNPYQHYSQNYNQSQNYSQNYGQNYAQNYGQNPGQRPSGQRNSGSFIDSLTGAVNRFAGGSGAVRPPVKELFSETFKKHTTEEAEAIFICGTPSTTPNLSTADTVWPKPWLYLRIFAAFAAAFLMLHVCCIGFGNVNALPGTIILGSFMVPVAVMIFFFELNTPKNISFYTLMKIFLVGGCASLLLTLLLLAFFPVEQLDYAGAIMTGIIEEAGKLGIVAYFLYKEKDAIYNINGMLIGAAVGAGFAAFESAGYAYQILQAYGYEGMLSNIFLRAFLAPGGHVVWAAMTGYAIMLVKKYTGPTMTGYLQQKQFWQVFWMPVALHSVWDMPFSTGQEVPLVPALLLLLSWVVIFVFINNSLGQLGRLLRHETVLIRE